MKALLYHLATNIEILDKIQQNNEDVLKACATSSSKEEKKNET